ncbi:hypothetical protein HIM_03761 [Hirsutella minnesotensis 3608]|uniref:Uncharacterized protein n=1 Tax=Hirsutella minnesotensis 3608 TaxID=1043627 RepID=A0A0F8A6D4_9HYPO|nr:hypothetical protein HIM_03761 [Hirsutella minnesotensis 3608]
MQTLRSGSPAPYSLTLKSITAAESVTAPSSLYVFNTRHLLLLMPPMALSLLSEPRLEIQTLRRAMIAHNGIITGQQQMIQELGRGDKETGDAVKLLRDELRHIRAHSETLTISSSHASATGSSLPT